MKEIWKEIKGFEGLYEISNLGRVKSNERYAYRKSKTGTIYYAKWAGRILTPSVDNCRIFTCKTGKKWKIHII